MEYKNKNAPDGEPTCPSKLCEERSGKDGSSRAGARDVLRGRFMLPGGEVLLEPWPRLDAALGHEADVVVDLDRE